MRMEAVPNGHLDPTSTLGYVQVSGQITRIGANGAGKQGGSNLALKTWVGYNLRQ